MSSSASASTGSERVLVLIAGLVAIYAISQFLRNSIGVIASDLARELDMSAGQVGLLSSTFFFSFAAAQIPVGIAIDRYGPKRTMLATATLAVLGTALFALAPSPTALVGGRILMGLGCSTFLMAPLAIYARRFPPERFAGLTSLQMGFANLGTLVATAPLAASAATIGWRPSFLIVAALSAAVALALIWVVPRDDASGRPRETWSEAFRGVATAMGTASFWPVFFAHLTAYSAFATVIGLWAGPWLSDVYGLPLEARGGFLLLGAVAQIVGLLVWGKAQRIWRGHKAPVLIGGVATVLLLAVAAVAPLGLQGVTVWLIAFGFAAAFTPILTAHGKALFPPTLTGRGITLMNIGAIGGTFLSQSVTGQLIDWVGRGQDGRYPAEGYQLVFASLAGWLLLSLLFYAASRDPAR
jgi:predicted MFS family arabinose efflux permease